MWEYYFDEFGELLIHKKAKDPNSTLTSIEMTSRTPLLNMKNINGENPMLLAIKYNSSLAFDIIANSKYFDKNTLNEIDKDGYLPIYYAIIRKYEQMINYMIQQGAKLDKEDNFGRTGIWYIMNKVKYDSTQWFSMNEDFYININLKQLEGLDEKKKNFVIASGFSPIFYE